VAPRVGLNREAVVEAAASFADEEGLEGVTLAELAARLGVRTPSFYNHVAGLEGLRRELALLGIRELLLVRHADRADTGVRDRLPGGGVADPAGHQGGRVRRARHPILEQVHRNRYIGCTQGRKVVV